MEGGSQFSFIDVFWLLVLFLSCNLKIWKNAVVVVVVLFVCNYWSSIENFFVR